MAMCLEPAEPGEEPAEDYSGWPLRDRLELLAFDALLAGVLCPHPTVRMVGPERI